MFKNLIESSSHRSEYRRRGSFFLFTTASYALFFVIAGIASIYAYDARMEDQNIELATIMPLVDLPIADPPRDTAPSPAAARDSDGPQNFYLRRIAMATVDNTRVPPATISTTPNPDLPMPAHGIVKFGNENADPRGTGGNDSETGIGEKGGSPTPVITVSDPPLPQPTPKPVPKVIRKTILNGEALALPKPPYPLMAKQIKVQGTVNVQVLIDEQGKVVSATPVLGHPLLVHAARNAALQARFSPTFLGDQPVKVSGVITYNFVLQ